MTNDNSKTKLDMPYVAVLPYNILTCKELTDSDKIYFGCLVGLAKNEGYVYATDEQLMEMFHLSERTINRRHRKLESLGFIARHTKNISYRDKDDRLLWRKKRKIYIGKSFGKPDTDKRLSNKNCGTDKGGAFNDTDTDGGSDEPDTDGGYNSKPIKKEPIKQGKGETPKTPVRTVGRSTHVQTTEEEHQKLKDEYGEETRDKAYQALSDWKEDTTRSKWKKNDYRSIRRWVIDSLKEKKTKSGKSRAKNLTDEQRQAYDVLF